MPVIAGYAPSDVAGVRLMLVAEPIQIRRVLVFCLRRQIGGYDLTPCLRRFDDALRFRTVIGLTWQTARNQITLLPRRGW